MEICPQCGKQKDLSISVGICFDCVTDNMIDYQKIEDIEKEGHTHHCASRQVLGDGECECQGENKLIADMIYRRNKE